MNTVKSSIAMLCFLGVTLWLGFLVPEPHQILMLVVSGALGLGIGDWLLLNAFRDIGPGRTMMLFGFQPLIMGLFGFLFFDQIVNAQKFWAILFFICCLVTISRESFRLDRSYHFKGTFFALGGMVLDGAGAVLTRTVFDQQPELVVFEANFYRCLGALFFFMLFARYRPISLVQVWWAQSTRGRFYLVVGSLLGTFISLSLYVKALQTAHLASLSGIAITGTLFSSILECIIKKEWPSSSLLLAMMFFFGGMYILIFF
jgi:drug/metabolite transporter (DMT)-like permease